MSTSNPTAPAPTPDPVQVAFQAGTGYIVSAAFQCALQLKVADHLLAGPQSVATLAAATGALEDPLYRILRALASVGLFEETAPRTFGNTPASAICRSDVPGPYPMLLWLSEPFHFQSYAELMHSATTGQPAADKLTGMPVFEYFAQNQALSAVFNEAMTSFSGMIIPAVLDVYDFSGIDVLVDVAGGHGQVLTSVLARYPGMRGILIDLAHVVAGAAPRIAAMGLTDRCTTMAGDFFASVPAGGDAYVMKHIIHDWEDDRAEVILKNIRAALADRPNGRLLLLESVLQPGDTPDLAKMIDIEMLALPGGRERSADEFARLFARSGFALTRVVPTTSPLSVIEGRPV